MRVLLLASLMFLSACSTAKIVRRDYSPKKGGVVRYWPESKIKADSKAKEFCEGDFITLTDGEELDRVNDVSSKYKFLKFECKANG